MDKKFLKSIMIASMAIYAAGCSAVAAPDKPSETPTPAATQKEQVTEVTETPAEEPVENEELQQGPLEGDYAATVLNFLENLKNKDCKAACVSMGMQDTIYEFLADTDISSYSVRRVEESEMDPRYLYNEQYEATLKVENSKNPRIPVGISKWLICTPDVASEIAAFFPMEEMVKEVAPEDANIPLQYEDYIEVFNNACDFSYATQCFDADEKTLEQLPMDAGTLHLLMHSLSPMDNEGKLTVDEFKKLVYQNYGAVVSEEAMQDFISNFLEERDLLEGEDHQTINTWNCGHGLGNYLASIKDAKSEAGKKIIQVEYYGDCSYFYEAKVVEYTFEQGEEDIWQLKKVQTLEDTGYKLGIEAV